MSTAPCQVCGGTGFVDVQPAAGEPPRQPSEPNKAGENRPSEPPQKMPCPACSGSGVSSGV